MIAEDARWHFHITMHIALCGLSVWMFGSWEFLFSGWLTDPAVAKTGKAIAVAAGPVAIINFIRAYRLGAFQS